MKLENEKEALAVAKASWLGLLSPKQIALDKFLKQFVPIQLADHAARVIVIRDISGVLSQQVADNLVDRIVTFFTECVEHMTENAVHILFVIAGHCKLDCIFHHDFDLL